MAILPLRVSWSAALADRLSTRIFSRRERKTLSRCSEYKAEFGHVTRPVLLLVPAFSTNRIAQQRCTWHEKVTLTKMTSSTNPSQILQTTRWPIKQPPVSSTTIATMVVSKIADMISSQLYRSASQSALASSVGARHNRKSAVGPSSLMRKLA